MKFPNLTMNKYFAARAFVLLAGLFLMSLTVPAQNLVTAENPGLEQCQNGPASAPVQCTPDVFVRGNANEQKAHYAESQFIPYRFTLRNTIEGQQYSVTLGYDVLKNGAHAIDYWGTYNNTELNADPCSDLVPGCTFANASKALIPKETASSVPAVPASHFQPQGVFAMWGGTITNVPSFVVQSGDHHSIIVNFTAGAGGSVVLAWSGHIAFQGDWPGEQTAINIGGSPYHASVDSCVNFGGCGQLDVQLSTSATVPSAVLRIIKVANTADGTGTAFTPFPFSATCNFGGSCINNGTTFTIVDNVAGSGGGQTQSQAVTSFNGTANVVTVTEGTINGWTLAGIDCVSNVQGSATTDYPAGRSITATLAAPGGLVTCTFTNSQLAITAAPASVSGRVTTASGAGVSRIAVQITDRSTGEVRSTLTNSFGFYKFSDLDTGDFYQVRVDSKKYNFSQAVKSFSLTADLFDVNFIANK